MKLKINVLSLFDGISAGRLALQKADIKVASYARSEIDKYANQVALQHFPQDKQLGDVTQWRKWDIDWFKVDLLIGGSPCQGFSFAGKQLAFDDPRSKLFFEYVDILKHIKVFNPDVKFMLENVKMKKEHIQVINDQLGVEPVVINSALVSAQNRTRLYWCNWDVPQPKDRKIYLGDILEKNKDLTHYVVNPEAIPRYIQKNGLPKGYCDAEGKSKCLTASSSKGYGNDGTTIVKCGAFRGRYLIDGKRQDAKMKTAGLTTQMLEVRDDYKSNTLTTVQKDNCVVTINNNEISYRKLTPIECERLQTVPDNYTATTSNTQRYKALGNSWTVDVVSHIFSYME